MFEKVMNDIDKFQAVFIEPGLCVDLIDERAFRPEAYDYPPFLIGAFYSP